MKHLLNLSINVPTNLTSLNLRGEGRWEYNTLNALLSNGKQVHTTRQVWKSTEPRPDNLFDGTSEAWVPESVLMVHGAGRSLFIERTDARAYSIQFHEPPFGQAKEDFLSYLKQKRIIATVSSQDPWIWQRLAQPFGKENVYHMAGAMVPYVDESADNFRKPNVTWTYRNFYDFVENRTRDMIVLFDFLDQCLTKEPEMRIAIIVGLWNSARFGTQPDKQAIKEWALSFPAMQQYRHLWNKIDFHIDLHWHDVISLLRETRWIISPGGPLGCPPYEAAMFGIPMIVGEKANPFMTLNGGSLFPELLTAPITIEGKFIQTLSRLQTDHQFYRKTGDAYRLYTKNNATFSAYVQQLDRIFTERGWNV